jgi:ABC-type molybdate transport system substrate-binding protein
MKRMAAILVLLVLVVLVAGCATTGSSSYPTVTVGGYSQFRYTTFHGGSR